MALPASFKPDSTSGSLPSSFKPDAAPQQPQSSFSDQIWSSLVGYGQNVGNTLQDAGNQVNSAFNAPGQGAIERGINTAGAVAGGALNTVASAIPGATTLGKGLGGAVNAAGNIGNTLGSAVNQIPGVNFDKNKYNAANASFANSSAGNAAGRVATVGNSLGNVANVALAGAGAASGIQSSVDAVKDTMSGVKTINSVSDALTPAPEGAAKSSVTTPAQQANIDAVNPDLTGKKLIAAVKKTVTTSREVTPPSIFREQGLTPDEQTINLGKRLADPVQLSDGSSVDSISLGKDHVANLKALGSGLDATENALDQALKGDPEINYNAQKPQLMAKLEDAKMQTPREVARIRDSATVYHDVMDFAQEKIQAADDSITGIRDARTAFDAQAAREYPSAFKEGKIDVKTPAGSAIKTARDLINNHLYDTAPNGSDIQTLIGREADIFRATDGIAPKAAAGVGKTSLGQWAKDHPTLARYLKYAAIGVGGGVGGEVVHSSI